MEELLLKKTFPFALLSGNFFEKIKFLIRFPRTTSSNQISESIRLLLFARSHGSHLKQGQL